MNLIPKSSKKSQVFKKNKKDYYLLILYQAKQVHASSVPAIVLDNVVVLRDTP